jgi:hypothetical protein
MFPPPASRSKKGTPLYKFLIPAVALVALAACNQQSVTQLEAAAQVVGQAVEALQVGQATYGYVGNVASVGGKAANVVIVAGTNVTPATGVACAASVNQPEGPDAVPAIIKVLQPDK